MRVLHVVTLHTPTHAFGGPTRVALNLCQGLRHRGVDAQLLALADGFTGPPPQEVEGVPAHLHTASHVLPKFEVSGVTSLPLLREARRLIANADVVHVHLMRDLVTTPVALLALASGTPLVLQTHGMVDRTEKRLARVIDQLAVRRVLRRADVTTFLTPHEAREVAEVGGPERSGVLEHLVNGVPVGPCPARPVGAPVVLYLARFQTRKRPVMLVEAFAQVLRSHPDARLVLAGPDSGELAPTMAAVERLGLAHAVDHVGPLSHEESMTALASASVYVLPSEHEPFPMSVLEALSVGTPVVVSPTNGLSGEVRAAGAGRVAEGADAVAGAILELLDPLAGKKASVEAYDLARRTFAIEAVVDRLLGLYAVAVDRHSAARSGVRNP